MARSRYVRLGTVGGNAYESFVLDQSSFVKEPDTFEGVEVIEYTVKHGERLDHLAHRFLNDEQYWWVIALINNISDPFVDPGQKLLIPVDVVQVLDRV